MLDELGLHDDPLLKVAIELEKVALTDPYFIEKKLYPNIDFYSGITLKALGFPTSMFTALFALARTVGWIAQWKEMLEDPHQKIGRPRQIYTGPTERDYVAMDKRKSFRTRQGNQQRPRRAQRRRLGALHPAAEGRGFIASAQPAAQVFSSRDSWIAQQLSSANRCAKRHRPVRSGRAARILQEFRHRLASQKGPVEGGDVGSPS